MLRQDRSTTSAANGAGRLRALVVDDRRATAGSLAELMHREQFVVRVTATVHDTVQSARDHDPDLIVLDLAMPDFDVLEACRQLRAVTGAYLVVLSARQRHLDAAEEPVAADTFITDVLSPRELVARLRTLVRRPARPAIATAATATAPPSRSCGALHVDIAHRRVHLKGTAIALTRIEFEVLAVLASRPGAIFTRRQIAAAVWGASRPISDALVEVHIGKLRRKLGDDSAAPRYVKTVRGSGYRLATR